MKYTLYFQDDCCTSQQVRHFVQTHQLPVRVAPVEEQPTGRVMVVPSLFGEGKLWAVGPDIMDYLRRIFARH